ncbi:MAG: hypothetical protein F6K35_36270 [Okeania sp. SIO2H7]|nr:hypothetical protein [Okeania sp. SIO2H7]
MLNQMDKAIQENKEITDKLNKFETQVKKYQKQQIKNLKNETKNFFSRLENKPSIEQSFNKWEMQTNLKDIKHELNKMTSVFKVHGDMMYLFEKMNDAIDTVADISERIEGYKEKQQMVDYIANVNAAGVKDDYPEVNELKQIILKNTIRERYNTLISTVKQWAFPCAENFFKNINNIGDFKDSEAQPDEAQTNPEETPNITININILIENIERLETNIKNYNAQVGMIDAAIMKTRPEHFMEILFTWERDKYGADIDKLLKGSQEEKLTCSDEVLFKSSVTECHLNGFKFNQIAVRIKHINPNKQEELNSCLEDFEFHLKHSMTSSYKYNNKYYKFIGNNYKDDNKKDTFPPIIYGKRAKNQALEKIEQGAFILSPYTDWKIQLYLSELQRKKDFTDLEQYSGHVYLELVGRGSYINQSAINNFRVDEYYEVDKTIPKVNTSKITD